MKINMKNKEVANVVRSALKEALNELHIDLNDPDDAKLKKLTFAVVDELNEYSQMTSEDMYKMANTIIAKGGYINDHYEGCEDENTLQTDVGGVVLLGKGELALWFGGNSCLNNCYIDDNGIPHLSCWSNGGSIYVGATTVNKVDVDNYNKSVSDSFKIVDFVPIFTVGNTLSCEESFDDKFRRINNEIDAAKAEIKKQMDSIDADLESLRRF